MNKYISNTIIFSILLFQVTSPCFTWAGTLKCSDLQNNLPPEFAALDLDELRAVTIQLTEKLEQCQEILTNAKIGYYFQFSKLYHCMVGEGTWAPIAKRETWQSPMNWTSISLGPNRMTKEQIQKLPPEVIHSIWWDLDNIQIPWLTVEQLNYRLSRGPLAPPHKTYLTKDQVQGISQENVQNALDEYDFYRWRKWLTDEQLSWLSPEQLHVLRLNT